MPTKLITLHGSVLPVKTLCVLSCFVTQNQFQLNVNIPHIPSKIDATAEASSPLHGNWKRLRFATPESLNLLGQFHHIDIKVAFTLKTTFRVLELFLGLLPILRDSRERQTKPDSPNSVSDASRPPRSTQRT